MKLHLLPNAHLDPVWLWDWREGLNEGLITVATILDLMDENPELTFIRGESSIYEHIERTDRKLFRRLAKMIEAERWDIVGGTLVQPDSNLAGTETLCRQFEIGLKYFESRFGKRPVVAWQADSFSHTPGWPNILQAFGFNAFAFTRPQRNEFALDTPVFHWRGTGSSKLLCYRQYWDWYCAEKGNARDILDETLRRASGESWENVGVLIGLGNHGGGPTRRHLSDVQKWADEHPDVEVLYSTLHRFIRELEGEIGKKKSGSVPVVDGDLGYCLRGCYSSVQKFKESYRQAERLVGDVQITNAVISAALRGNKKSLDLNESWDAICFNAFHDILPGSSIERAYDEQSAWVGVAAHRARQVQLEILNRLVSEIDTRVPAPEDPDAPRDVPVLLWNPQSRPFSGVVEVETSLDYRPLWHFKDRQHELPVVVADGKGKAIPFQRIATEHLTMRGEPWRTRVVVPTNLPAWGWKVLRVGWRESFPDNVPEVRTPVSADRNLKKIESEHWQVQVRNGRLQIRNQTDSKLFAGQDSIKFCLMEDSWGSWGGMVEERDSFVLRNVIETFAITRAEIIEEGPIRSSLWVRWEGSRSSVDLTFQLSSEEDWIVVSGRTFLNEREARLKMIFPCRGDVSCAVPGGTVPIRQVDGHNPIGRWVKRTEGDHTLGFVTDVLSDCDFTRSELRLTLARASRYAADAPLKAGEMPWLPTVDRGELKFNLAIFSGQRDPDQTADAFLSKPMSLHVAPGPGQRPSQGGFGGVSPKSLKVLSVEFVDDTTLTVRIQNLGGRRAVPKIRFLGRVWEFDALASQEIRICELGLSAGLVPDVERKSSKK